MVARFNAGECSYNRFFCFMNLSISVADRTNFHFTSLFGTATVTNITNRIFCYKNFSLNTKDRILKINLQIDDYIISSLCFPSLRTKKISEYISQIKFKSALLRKLREVKALKTIKASCPSLCSATAEDFSVG